MTPGVGPPGDVHQTRHCERALNAASDPHGCIGELLQQAGILEAGSSVPGHICLVAARLAMSTKLGIGARPQRGE